MVQDLFTLNLLHEKTTIHIDIIDIFGKKKIYISIRKKNRYLPSLMLTSSTLQHSFDFSVAIRTARNLSAAIEPYRRAI